MLKKRSKKDGQPAVRKMIKDQNLVEGNINVMAITGLDFHKPNLSSGI